MQDPKPGRRAVKPKKRLAPSEKYEVFIQVLTQQATQREAAEKFGVDRSTVVSICRTAKQGALDALAAAVPGRPGQSPRRSRAPCRSDNKPVVCESPMLRGSLAWWHSLQGRDRLQLLVAHTRRHGLGLRRLFNSPTRSTTVGAPCAPTTPPHQQQRPGPARLAHPCAAR